MATCLPLGKETAGTIPFSAGVAHLMVIVLSMENDGQTRENNTVRFLSIPSGFFDLSDKARPHHLSV